MIYLIIKVLFATYLLWKISSTFDLAANFLTRKIGEGIKGPTINAIASSLPELFISTMFLFYYGDIKGFSASYATIIGSSAFNIAVIPVVSFLIVYFKSNTQKFEIDRVIVKQDGIFLIGAIILFLLGFLYGINIYFTCILIGYYIVYVWSLYNSRKSNKSDFECNNIVETESSNGIFSDILNLKFFSIFNSGKITTISSLFTILFSIIVIGFSCDILITSTEDISKVIGINLFFVSFFIASISSSIPDTFLSVKDATNGKFKDSFSNAYGSNMFDICIGLGLPLLVYIIINGTINTDFPIKRIGIIGDSFLNGNVLLWSIILLLVFTITTTLIYYYNKLKLQNAIIVLLLYFLFMFGLIIF